MEDDTDGGAPLLLWSVFNLPEIVTNIPAGEAWDTQPPGLNAGANGAGRAGYLPPRPAAGKAHRYHLEVFALDNVLTLPNGAAREDLLKSMKGHVVASGETVATFQAP